MLRSRLFQNTSEVAEQDHEFVSAQAMDDALLTDHTLQLARDFDQQPIAD